MGLIHTVCGIPRSQAQLLLTVRSSIAPGRSLATFRLARVPKVAKPARMHRLQAYLLASLWPYPRRAGVWEDASLAYVNTILITRRGTASGLAVVLAEMLAELLR